MEVMLSVFYDTKNLAGKPDEYDPFVAVWTTDMEQTQTVVKGKAVDILELDARGQSKRSVSFSNAGGSFPIKDIMADVCIALYTRTQSDGSSKDAGKKRPYTLDIGQINVPWHVILRFMISEGSAFLAKLDKAELDKTQKSRVFPSVKVRQEVRSQVTYEGVEYEIQAQMNNDKDLAMELREVGADMLSRRGSLVIIASLVMTSPETLRLSLNERIDRIEYFYLNSTTKYKGKAVLGEKAPSRLVKASQEYDRRTSMEDKVYNKAMDRYRGVYDALWTATGGKQLIIKSHDGEKTTLLSPDVPSMNRFHLPTWNICNDRVPYAEWILQTVPANASHLAKPTLGTEHFLGVLADMAFKRVHISREEFIATVDDITIGMTKRSVKELDAYLIISNDKRTLLIKSVELVYYTIMMVAHATRYGGDGRIIRLFKRMLRIDVEAPQHDMVAGTSDDGDCEDEEKPEIIISSLIELGRLGADVDSGGRGWTDPLLAAMRRVLQLYADFTIFGSVSGRQISDAERKKGIEDEEGFIHTMDDISEQIGGHTFMISDPLLELAERYEEHEDFIDMIVGYSVSQRIREFQLGVVRGWNGSVHEEHEKKVFEIYASLPIPIMEGTGRQEPLQLPLEHYFGISDEFLRRLAERASEIDLLDRWPKALEDNKKRNNHSGMSSSESDSESEREESKMHVPSMGDAAPYMFQKRLTMRSMNKCDKDGKIIQRHISSFYRRPCHSVSCKLHQIMPNDFVHLIFVDPVRRTYGPPLRYVLERGGNAIPIPLSRELHKVYLNAVEREDGYEMFVSDLLARRMRRVIPYDLSFQHLTLEETKETTTRLVVPSETSLTASVRSCTDFFCRSDFEHITQRVETHSISVTNGSSNHKPLVIEVGSDSPVADAIRTITKNDMTTSFLVENVYSRMVTRPLDGNITKENIRLLSQHVLAGNGVSNVAIYSERVLPWLCDNLCAHYQRSVRFDISQKASISSRAPMKSAQQRTLMSSNRLDLLFETTQMNLYQLIDELQVNINIIRPERLRAGILVELEHGTKLVHWQTNVTADNLRKTAQIALAHLVENPGFRDATKGDYLIPDYYHMLADMEREADKKWEGINKPSIFIPKRFTPLLTSSLSLPDDFYIKK